MSYLREQDYDDLPEDDDEAFVRLEGLSRDRLHQADTDEHNNLTYQAAMRYMNEIAALADQFEISGITYNEECSDFHSEYGRFTRAVEYRVAQIRVQKARRARRNSVAISGSGRERIQHYLERVKAEIAGAEIPDKRKRELLGKIADFEAELSKKRFDLAKAMAVVALIAATAHDLTGILVESPKIMHSISEIIGAEKIDDEERAKLLPQREPFKAIPDFRPKPPARNGTPAFGDDLDDDVPF